MQTCEHNEELHIAKVRKYREQLNHESDSYGLCLSQMNYHEPGSYLLFLAQISYHESHSLLQNKALNAVVY